MMKSLKSRACLLTAISSALLLTTASLVIGQTVSVDLQRTAEANADSWKRFNSPDGRFAVLFPGTPRISEETISSPPFSYVIHKTQLTSFAEYGVIYSDYPKSIVERSPADELLDQGAKAAVSGMNSQLLSINPITINGYPGRLLKERLSDGTIMQAKMVLVGQRLFQVAITTPKEEGADPATVGFYNSTAKKFLDSFEIVKTDINSLSATILLENACPPDVSNCVGIDTDDLRERAINLPNPAYPPIARAAQASGTVEVAVVVDEQGRVISARAISGHPLLQAAAVSAARYARFNPVSINSKPDKMWGIIKYYFVLE